MRVRGAGLCPLGNGGAWLMEMGRGCTPNRRSVGVTGKGLEFADPYFVFRLLISSRMAMAFT